MHWQPNRTTGDINILQLKSIARRLKQTRNLGMIVIDYLQLMNGGNNSSENRNVELSVISRSLKNLAKELGIVIIALAQMSRDIEKQARKEERLSDIRDCGGIEQDADMVGFLSRPDYQMNDVEKAAENIESDLFVINVKKYRHGSLEKLELKCNLAIQKITDKSESLPFSNSHGNYTTIKENPF